MAIANAHSPHLERPLKVTISYTHTCNLDCAHCYADCGVPTQREELSAPAWKSFIDQSVSDGVMSVYFEGGEPFHRPDFLEVLEHAAQKAMSSVRCNGTLLSEETARKLKQWGVAIVYVDLMGATAKTHDTLTGVAGSFHRAVEGIRACVAVGLNTQIVTIMNRTNVGELQPWLELVDSLGVRTAGILRPYPIGRPRRNWYSFSLSLNEMTAALAGLQIPAGMRLMQSWHPNDANCCWQMAAVNAWGDSIGCSYLREFVNYGNIRHNTLLETWGHPLCRTLRSGVVDHDCTECSESQGSHGGCRSTAYAFHGHWTASDPFDASLNQGVNLRELPSWMREATNGAPLTPRP